MRDSSIGPALSLWDSADLLPWCPQGLPTAALGPQLLQLPQGTGMVGTAKVGEVGHELLGRLVITPAVKESASTEGAAFQSLLQPGRGGVITKSVTPES